MFDIQFPESIKKTFKEKLIHETILRSIKVIDIGFITIIYVFVSFFTSVEIDNKLGRFNPVKADKKSLFRIFLELCLHIYLIGVYIYIVRNLIELIPYPLQGYEGYQHQKLKELGGGVMFGYVFFLFQNHLKEKMIYFYNRINKGRTY